MDGFVDDAEEDDRRVVLRTARLTLRAPRREDARAIANLANNPQVAENLSSMPHPYDETDAIAWIDRPTPRESAARFVILQGRLLIGAVGCGKLEPEADFPEIGYWIGQPYWGCGFGTEAAQAMIDHVFNTTRNRQILGSCRVTNRTSRRVLQKCGFQYFGDDMIHSRYFNSAVAVHRFRLERAIWASLKAWGAGAK